MPREPPNPCPPPKSTSERTQQTENDQAAEKVRAHVGHCERGADYGPYHEGDAGHEGKHERHQYIGPQIEKHGFHRVAPLSSTPLLSRKIPLHSTSQAPATVSHPKDSHHGLQAN